MLSPLKWMVKENLPLKMEMHMKGEFSNGIFNGKGTYKSAQGWTYTGQFKWLCGCKRKTEPPKDKQHTKEHLNRGFINMRIKWLSVIRVIRLFFVLLYHYFIKAISRWLCWGRPILYPVWLSDNCNAYWWISQHTKKLTSLPFSVVESIALPPLVLYYLLVVPLALTIREWLHR